MEPSDLNARSNDDAALVTLLREHLPALPDDGFSTRVMAALPRPAPSTSRLPWLAYFGGGAAGAIFAVTRADSWSEFVVGVHEFGEALSALAGAFSNPWLLLGAMVSLFSVLSALPFLRLRHWQ